VLTNQRSVVLLQLSGGLGNQMFQYHAGFLYSEIHNIPLVLDFSRVDGDKTVVRRTKAGLSQLGIRGLTLPKGEILQSRKLDRYVRSNTLANLSDKWKKSGLIDFEGLGESLTQKDLDFHRPFAKKTRLRGYFQSLHLLQGAETNGSNLKFESERASRNFRNISGDISKKNDLGIHVRLGDYLIQGNAPLIFTDYYQRAINRAILDGGVKRIWIFSDDSILCRQLLSLDTELEVIYVPSSLLNDIESMEVLSMFSRVVISNSSFSYLAAYKESRDKEVFCPSPWFMNSDVCIFQNFPSTWHEIQIEFNSKL
jgi:hypothetical protein